MPDLIFDVDEVLCVPDVLHVSLQDGGVDESALLAGEEAGARRVQLGRVRRDRPEELHVPRPARVGMGARGRSARINPDIF